VFFFYFGVCSIFWGLCPPSLAQQKEKARIGYLALRASPSDADKAFVQGLLDLGYIENRNIAIEYRWAAGNVDQLSSLAKELVQHRVDIIVASSTPATQAAKNATTAIPIVMTGSADPVGTGLIASLARPGGNITGMSAILPELAGKRLELLKDLVPKLSRVAFLVHGGDPAHTLFLKEAEDAAAKFRMEIEPLVVRSSEEIPGAFSEMIRKQAGALIVQPLFVGNLDEGRRIAQFAIEHHLPTVSDGNQFAEAGGLSFYGPDRLDQYRRSAVYVDNILKGRKPAELPVEQPRKFELVINLKTAKQIGLTIPPNVLARADKVIR
jgi:putative ABC transport system substrate-binding protein